MTRGTKILIGVGVLGAIAFIVFRVMKSSAPKSVGHTPRRDMSKLQVKEKLPDGKEVIMPGLTPVSGETGG